MKRDVLRDMFELMEKNLYGKRIRRIYNSIGSNLFLKIGHHIEWPGEKEKREEWIIWVSFSAWRISNGDTYIVGAEDNRDNIKIGIDFLLDKTVKEFRFTNDFLDFQIDFDDGYRLNTFLNCMRENIWTIFMPNGNTIRLNSFHFDDIKAIQGIGKEFAIVQQEPLMLLDINFENYIIKDFLIEKNNEIKIVFQNDFFLHITNATWRIEVNNEFLLGFFDEDKFDIENIKEQFIGQRLKQVSIDNILVDANFYIGDNLIIKTFSFTRSTNQWQFCKTFFRSDMIIQDL